MERKLLLNIVSSIQIIILCTFFTHASSQSHRYNGSLYSFGDSLADIGNNNHLQVKSHAKANYYPYGKEFDTKKATGRFSNGRVLSDYFAAHLGYQKFPQPYLYHAPRAVAHEGVSFASGQSGLLKSTGRQYGHVISFGRQVQQFQQQLVPKLAKQFKQEGIKNVRHQVARHLAHSLYYIDVGTDEFIQRIRARRNISTKGFHKTLINRMELNINKLYKQGARKFIIADIGSLGCSPLVIHVTNSSGCNKELNQHIHDYNKKMNDHLQAHFHNKLPDARYVFLPTFHATNEIIHHPSKYGVQHTTRACCGDGHTPCGNHTTHCQNSKNFVWWDPYHLAADIFDLLAAWYFKGSAPGGSSSGSSSPFSIGGAGSIAGLWNTTVNYNWKVTISGESNSGSSSGSSSGGNSSGSSSSPLVLAPEPSTPFDQPLPSDPYPYNEPQPYQCGYDDSYYSPSTSSPSSSSSGCTNDVIVNGDKGLTG